MDDDRTFVFESKEDAESIRRYLTAVMDGLQKGRLTLEAGERSFTLEPQGLFTFALRARRRDAEGRISLTLSWRRPEEDGHKPETLKIEA